MRRKLLFVVCFFLVVVNVAGCRKKSPSSEQQAIRDATKQKIEQIKLSKQTVSDKLDKSMLVKRLPSEPEPAVEVSEPEEETEYFAVFMEGRKVGYAVQKRLASGGKVTSSEELRLTLSRAGIPMTVGITSRSFETVEGKPLGFECVMDLGLMKVDISGSIQPDGKLELMNRSAETVQRSVVEWPSGALMSEGLQLLRKEKGIKEGTEYSCRVFDRTMTRAFDAKIGIGAKEQVDLLGRVVTLTEETTLLSIPDMGEVVSKSYLDEDLRLQKNVSPVMGFSVEMVACSKEFALGENDVLELVSKMFIDSPVSLGDLDSIKSMTYYLEPLPGANLVIPENDNQRVRQLGDGKLALTITPVTAPSGVSFPYEGNNETALKALEPTPYVQSDHSEIIGLARRAVGRTKDAAEAVGKIEAFVADYVDDKNLSIGYASAVEVATSRQGDCTEHAVLAAALCRAVGIPAQVVTGLAYVEEWRTVKNGFGGHAWTQAYIGDRWVGLDAAFRGTGRGGYDAGHIALAAGNGDPGDFFSLVTSMGQFRIDRIEVRK
ncbi:MAG: transglutaminase domain-containing protein [Sedimentisphaerales bacterium]|nr:transglutaminase domain-containing protein [Sedimentisphaerales bacterium]